MRARRLWLSALLICWGLPVHGAVTVRDAGGRELSLPQPATRVISLAPFLTELLYTVQAGDDIVAVSAFSDFPAPARKLPVIGDAKRIDIERVLTLRPDLVVAWRSGNGAADIERLERLGIRVFLAEPRRLDDIAPLMRDLGKLTGREVPAGVAAARFDAELAGLRARFAGRAPVRAFVQISARPLMTLSGAHVVSDLLGVCGGVNVFADAPVLAPQIGVEDVLVRDPQVILIVGTDPAAKNRWLSMPRLEAAQNEHVYLVPPDLILRPTVRVLSGIRLMCGHLGQARAR